MMKTPWPSLLGVWSLIRRAMLFAPLAGVLTTIWFMAWMGRFIFPVVAGLLGWESAWGSAAIALLAGVAAWPLLRLRFFQMNRRDFPNDGENV